MNWIRIILALASLALVSTLPTHPVLHPKVQQDLAVESQSSPLSLILYLKRQLDVASFVNDVELSLQHEQDDGKDERIAAMLVEALRAYADDSQVQLVPWLERHPSVKRIASFFIANVIAVDVEQPRAFLEELVAAFPDGWIAHVEPNGAFQVSLGVREAAAASEEELELLKFQTATQEDDMTLLSSSSSLQETEEVQWNLQWIGAQRVWNSSFMGQGMIYANADTGVVWQHETLRQSYLGVEANGSINHNYAWWDGVKKPLMRGVGKCGINSQEPCDDHGHGTHTTSTAVGGKGFGVAPRSQWMACRNMDRGVGSSESYLSCLQFFLSPTDLNGLNPRPDLRPHAIGNSYGCPDSEGCAWNTFTQAVKAIRAAGIFMSVSAGNEGPSCSTVNAPPAFEPYVVTVGSSGYKTSKISGFSSRGPIGYGGQSYRKPDVTAPGGSVRAAFPAPYGAPVEYRYKYYSVLSGTSMASPHVGGACLLIMQACPHLKRNITAVQLLVEKTAKHEHSDSTNVSPCGNDTLTSVPNNVYGWGGIDVQAAVDACLEL